ncbi:hypothetical protein HBB16_10455 [Pseudonocardia sp. MCCB 268]|nr:hypothetical protein [Pseudonocardia cytotoxica]
MLPASTSGPGERPVARRPVHRDLPRCVNRPLRQPGRQLAATGRRSARVIPALIQLGGLGLDDRLLAAGRPGVPALTARDSSRRLSRGPWTRPDIRRVIRNVVVFSIAAELVVTTVLAGPVRPRPRDAPAAPRGRACSTRSRRSTTPGSACARQLLVPAGDA